MADAACLCTWEGRRRLRACEGCEQAAMDAAKQWLEDQQIEVFPRGSTARLLSLTRLVLREPVGKVEM